MTQQRGAYVHFYSQRNNGTRDSFCTRYFKLYESENGKCHIYIYGSKRIVHGSGHRRFVIYGGLQLRVSL